MPEGRSGPALELIRGWVGHRLDDVGGAGVGRIEAAYVPEGHGSIEWMLARMGRFGHYTLVPTRDAVEGVEHVWVPYTRDHIRAAPRIEPQEALTVAAERGLREHYELAGDDRGAAELEKLDGDAISARPDARTN
ncbi:MAG TPA: hypothetical protein VK326_04855 [Solirubrobacterales bacterium]|nr:hypothetical protein [Solirubrobacterales bacterium]